MIRVGYMFNINTLDNKNQTNYGNCLMGVILAPALLIDENREIKIRVYGKRQTAEVTTWPRFLLICRLPFAVFKWR